MMKSKNKPSRNPCEQSLLITPLSVEACISKIQDMANFDLEVHIVHRSKYNAEIEFVERHNDDIPMYITSRLMASQDGTCVTFEDGSAKETEKTLWTYILLFIAGMVAIYLLWILLQIVLMIARNPEVAPVWLAILPIAFILGRLKRDRYQTSQSDSFDSDKMTKIRHQRAEVLKGDLYATLHIDPAEVRWDELGNEYYVDTNTYHEGRVKGT